MLKKFNPKKLLSYAFLFVLVVFILVLTWVPLIFDIDNLDIHKWVTNSLINVGIMVSAIILGEIFGEDKQKEKIGGLYQTALKKFNDTLARLTDELGIIIYFSQFYIWFKAVELKRKKEGYLVDHGFGQMLSHLIVEHIDKQDLQNMRNSVVIKVDEKTGKEIKFKRITEEEYDIISVIYSQNFTIDAPKYTYYLSAFGDSSSVSTLEQAKRIEKKERINKTFNRIFKIVLSLFISFIWGMATVQELSDGNIKEAMVNTNSRLIALIGGLLSGFMTSLMAVKLASQKLDNKTQVLTFMELHYNHHDFIPKTYEEMVEEELKEEEKESLPITPLEENKEETSSEEIIVEPQ